MIHAIRNKNTGLYIGYPRGKMMRGGTSREADEPIEHARPFSDLRIARWFLTMWLKGKHYEVQGRDWESGVVDDVRTEIELCPHRKREEMEIVEITMTPGKVVT